MKKLFALMVIAGFLFLGANAFAWQDSCTAVGETYTYTGGYTLINWTETPQFSPAPDCGGVVILFCPDGTAIELDYMGVKDTMWIYDNAIGFSVPCRVNEKGNLVCETTEEVVSEFTLSKR